MPRFQLLLKGSAGIYCMTGRGLAATLFCTLAGCCLAYVPSDLVEAKPKQWVFGDGLGVGDTFEYKICDSILRIPESPYPCYVAQLRFVSLLPTSYGNVWIVSMHVDHGARQTDAILRVSDRSFDIRTDDVSIPYADSLSRTLGWIKDNSKFESRTLTMGRSWGVVASDSGMPVDLLVTRQDSVQVGNKTVDTYLLGYLLAKESYVHIAPGFPFPLKAAVYKPVSSYPNTPLAFTLELLRHENSDLSCAVPNLNTQIPQYFVAKIHPDEQGVHDEIVEIDNWSNAEFDNLLGDDSDDAFGTVSSELEINEIERQSTLVRSQNYTNDLQGPPTMRYFLSNGSVRAEAAVMSDGMQVFNSGIVVAGRTNDGFVK